MNIKAFQEEAQVLVNRLYTLIESMPTQGLKCEDSQKVCLLQELLKLEYTINAIKEEDFIPNKEFNYNCGKTNIPVGAKVKIIKNTQKDEDWVIGITGIATHPFAFGCTEKDWIGIWVDEEFIENPYGTQMNVNVNEIEIIKEN